MRRKRAVTRLPPREEACVIRFGIQRRYRPTNDNRQLSAIGGLSPGPLWAAIAVVVCSFWLGVAALLVRLM